MVAKRSQMFLSWNDFLIHAGVGRSSRAAREEDEFVSIFQTVRMSSECSRREEVTMTSFVLELIALYLASLKMRIMCLLLQRLDANE